MMQRMEKGPKHHSVSKGKMVRVVLYDGKIIYGRFKEKNRRFCLLEEGVRIPWAKVKKFHIAPKVMIMSPRTGRE